MLTRRSDALELACAGNLVKLRPLRRIWVREGFLASLSEERVALEGKVPKDLPEETIRVSVAAIPSGSWAQRRLPSVLPLRVAFLPNYVMQHLWR